MRFENFKTDTTNLMINGDDKKLRHITTQVNYSYVIESESPDFEYGSKEENEKELARFDSGELLNVCLKVSCQALGETGTDYLGQCFVKANNLEAELLALAIEHDMKNNACIELKGNILCSYNALKSALGYSSEKAAV